MRRYDLDWWRVIVFSFLVFYHVGMFFVKWGFHIINNVIYDFLRWPMLNEAVYPFYILHQTIMIMIAFYLMDLQWGFFPKAFLMVSGTFAGSMLLYESFIRLFNLIRPLF